MASSLQKANLKNVPEVFEIGLSYTVVSASKQIHLGLCRSLPKYGNIVYACSALSYIYGEYSRELFGHSYLSLLFPDISFPDRFTKFQLISIKRGKSMLAEKVPKA